MLNIAMNLLFEETVGIMKARTVPFQSAPDFVTLGEKTTYEAIESKTIGQIKVLISEMMDAIDDHNMKEVFATNYESGTKKQGNKKCYFESY